MKTELLTILNDLKKLNYVDKKAISDLEVFIETNTKYTRDENPDEHVCAFFIPVVLEERLVFVGHHKKADDWIPPGGHVDAGEIPLRTVHREMQEELQFTITTEKVMLFDCANKSIMKEGIRCKRHYDLVYLVYLEDATDFPYDKKEFYDAKWVSFEEAAQKTKTEAFKPMMQHLRDLV